LENIKRLAWFSTNRQSASLLYLYFEWPRMFLLSLILYNRGCVN